MSRQQRIDSSSRENNLSLAIQAHKANASLSTREAAKLYDVPQSSLNRRLAGTTSRANYRPVATNLTVSEESAIVQHVLDLDAQGFPPTKDMVRNMANKLLAERHKDSVGKNWPDTLIKRTPNLKTQ